MDKDKTPDYSSVSGLCARLVYAGLRVMIPRTRGVFMGGVRRRESGPTHNQQHTSIHDTARIRLSVLMKARRRYRRG